jgi:hypothetical protein
MIRKTLKRTAVLLSFTVLFSAQSSAQFDRFDDLDINFDFLRSTPTDAVKFLKAYMSPFANAFGAGLNGGWYNTAKPHKPLGFDITMSLNVGIVPASDNQFDVSSLGMTNIKGTGLASSVSGPQESGPAMTYEVGGNVLAGFNCPGGTDWKFVPVPTIQAGVGLPLGSEVKVRFVPKIRIEGGDFSLWGVGLMHNITQYLPADRLLPFDVSIFGGYTTLATNLPLNVQPDADISAYTSPYDAETTFENQKMNLTVSGINISAIASLNLPVINFYGGLGYSKTSTVMQLSGYFPTPVLEGTVVEYNNSGVVEGSGFGNLDIENYSGLRATIGFRVKLAIVTIHADYTRAQYNVVSAGLGFSFR